MNKLTARLATTTATLTIAGALMAPPALALSKAERMAEAANNKVEALEAQLQQMQYELQVLRAERAERAPVDTTAKVQELEQWMHEVKAAPAPVKHANAVFFRGGYAGMDNPRNGVSIQSDAVPLGAQDRADPDAWYIGAGFDFGLTDDVWGMMRDTEVLAELMFEYKEFGNANGNCLASNPTCLAEALNIVPPGTSVPRDVTVNQFTLSAAPKVKFMKGSDFRPWLIPAGLGLHVISPPSESITVLNPGVMFAAGGDYRLWKDIFIGADARYHLSGAPIDGVDTDGLTAGGYIGIGF